MRRILSVAAALVTAASLTLTALPAFADNVAPNRGRYAALGDSFAAGAGNELLRNDDSGRSSHAYPVLLAGSATKVTFLAVPGATTADVMAHQLPQLPGGARQVTLTVGGNDAGFGAVVQACLSQVATPESCAAAIAAGQSAIPGVGASVGGLIAAIHQQAPAATIYVTGYPELFQCEPGTNPVADQIDAASGALSAVIAGAVAGAVASGIDAQFVGVADEFDGHGLCQGPESYLFGAGVGVPLHPNAWGQEAYADAVADALEGDVFER